jgi:GT2 family glycosyltransferase
MLLCNDALDRMVTFMDANPDVGAAGCKLLNKDGALQRSCWRGFPSPRTLLIDLFYLSKWLPRLSWVRDFEAALQNAGEPTEVDYLLGACLMVRREVLDRVGLLDESFFMFLEETDWCYRIKKNGWRIFWTPDGEIIHYGQQSVARDPGRFIPMLYRNYCRFSRKRGSRRREMVALKSIIMLGTLFRSALWACRSLAGVPNSRVMLRGYLAAFSAAPSY